ncbi:hypothetical protein QS257_19885 [Terrilactibacillus sp. S3-3]|nr:hypothetical protein QS257_19885 [Terrilactibacillus sp. S3-3]
MVKKQKHILRAQKVRSKDRIAKRKRFNTKKKAYEAAKRAGKGKVRHDRDSHGKKKPHYHPDVKGPAKHDHYYYPKRRW